MRLDLAVRRIGEGPAVVVMHGLFGSMRNWVGMAARFTPMTTWHLLDARNHGASPWASPMTYPTLAEDVAAYIEDAGLTRPVVIGHSMGGKTAMTLALTRPDLVGGLVVLDIAPGISPGVGRLGGVFDALDALPLATLARREDADAALAAGIPDASLRAFLLQNLVREGNGSWRWRLNLPVLRAALPDLGGFPTFPDAAAWSGPTLLVRGAESDYVSDGDRGEIRRLFPLARVVTVKGAGHWLHAQQPLAVSRVLRTFFDRTLGGRGGEGLP